MSETKMVRTCPDGGTCHHGCFDNDQCYRVQHCSPLSLYGEKWNTRAPSNAPKPIVPAPLIDRAKAAIKEYGEEVSPIQDEARSALCHLLQQFIDGSIPADTTPAPSSLPGLK